MRKNEEEGMTEQQLVVNLIDVYMELQRIKRAKDKEKELENQLRVVRAKLEVFGIHAEDLCAD